jgi:dienelactone hydrolase
VDSLSDFDRFEFAHDGLTRDVFRKGAGPAVVVIHEIPGITPPVARFARWVVDAGFTVFMPSLLGTPGEPRSVRNIGAAVVRACIAREFHVLARHRSSPVTDWLRALARQAHGECGGPGVGAVGMCLTGNFALSMVLEPCLLAPVLSQPSLPFPVTAAHRRALHLSPEELAALKRRARDEGLCVLGLRFAGDLSSPPERFETLRTELGPAFEGIEIPDAAVPDAHGLGPHSVLTEDLREVAGHPTAAARDRVLAFLRERLRPDQSSGD